MLFQQRPVSMNLYTGIRKNLPVILVLLFVGGIYLLFPTRNSTTDAIGYAADIKFGVPGMFTPHHLLYSKFFEWLCLPFRKAFPNADVLSLTKTFNSLFALGSLVLLARILKNAYHYPPAKIGALLLPAAFCFGFWRFSIDNESYIVAIFFSLSGTYAFLKLQLSEKSRGLMAVMAGFWAALACLFHQIHFFWWLALLISIFSHRKTRKYTLFYAFPAIIVPVIYGLVLVFNYHEKLTVSHFIHFVFYSYFSGSAPIAIGLKNIFFTAVALIRTFIQIYPTQLTLLKSGIGYYLPLCAGLLMLYYIVRNRRNVFLRTALRDRDKKLKPFVNGLIIVILLQFLFAAFSMGNAKFMIMLPLLMVLILPYFGTFDKGFSRLIIVFLFLWNFCYGAWPDYHYNYYNSQYPTAFLRQNPGAALITRNYGISDRYRYATGIEQNTNIIDVSAQPLNIELVDSLLHSNKPVYTDLIDYPTVYNRDYFTDNVSTDTFWKPFNHTKTDSFRNFYGKVYISRITK